MTTSHPRPSFRITRRVVGAILASGLVAVSLAGVAGAKEVAVGGGAGGGTTPAPCNPVSSLSYKGDATTADTGLATIDVTYSVKPCDKNPAVVTASMYESADPGVVVYNDPNAPLSGKFLVAGVNVRFSYQVTISVYDATTGARSGSKTIFAAANPKRV